MELKTIKGLAEELGVSKTAVRKYMTSEFRETHTQILTGNVIGIDSDGCKLIAETIRKPQETCGNQFVEVSENQGLREEVAFLRRQIEIKDRQIEEMSTRLAECTVALVAAQQTAQAAQALHAGTLQKQLTDGTDGEDKRHWWQFGRRRQE